jgi:hypothetical protein
VAALRRRDARGLLSTVLEGEQRKVGETRDIVAGAVDAEHATFITRPVAEFDHGIDEASNGGGLIWTQQCSRIRASCGLDGAGHVAWQVTGSDTRIGYCRVSAQTGDCNRRDTLSFPGAGGAADGGRPQVFTPSTGRVVIFATCSWCGTPSNATNRTYKWTSTDNGGSFGVPAEVGRGPTTGGFDTLLLDESFVGVEGSQAVHTQTVSAGATAGSTVTVRARAFIKVKRGSGPKKSISTTVRVCS